MHPMSAVVRGYKWYKCSVVYCVYCTLIDNGTLAVQLLVCQGGPKPILHGPILGLCIYWAYVYWAQPHFWA